MRVQSILQRHLHATLPYRPFRIQTEKLLLYMIVRQMEGTYHRVDNGNPGSSHLANAPRMSIPTGNISSIDGRRCVSLSSDRMVSVDNLDEAGGTGISAVPPLAVADPAWSTLTMEGAEAEAAWIKSGNDALFFALIVFTLPSPFPPISSPSVTCPGGREVD